MSTSGGDPPEPTPAAAVVPVTAPLQAIGQHGAVVPFEASQEEWSEYTERLGHYFVTNDIVGEEKRRAGYRLLKTLASPSSLTDSTI